MALSANTPAKPAKTLVSPARQGYLTTASGQQVHRRPSWRILAGQRSPHFAFQPKSPVGGVAFALLRISNDVARHDLGNGIGTVQVHFT
jgi:hypothetical protein